MIPILVAHRAALSRRALAEVLGKVDDIEVVAEAASGQELLTAATRTRPRVAVIDRALAGTMGIGEVCVRLRRVAPESGVLVVLDPTALERADIALARLLPKVGLVGIEATPAHLIESVRRIDRGEAVLDGDLAIAVLTSRDNPLTDRESQILKLVAAGVPVKDVAAQVHLSVGTVRNYLARIVAKTGARTRIEAVRIAQTAGWA